MLARQTRPDCNEHLNDPRTLGEIARSLHLINGLAKSAVSHWERQQWYAAKAVLLSQLIEMVSDPVLLLGYDRFPGDVLVQISLNGKGTWHCPFDALTARARAVVYSRLGSMRRPQAVTDRR